MGPVQPAKSREGWTITLGAKVCLEPSQKTGRMLVIALTAVARIPRRLLAPLVRIPPNGEDAVNGARTIPVLPGSLFAVHSRTTLQFTLMILQVH